MFLFDSVDGSVLPDLKIRIDFVSLNLTLLSLFFGGGHGGGGVCFLRGHFYFCMEA